MSRTLLYGCAVLFGVVALLNLAYAAAPAHPAAPPKPAAAPAAPAPTAPVLPVASRPSTSYNVKNIRIEDTVGTLHVTVSDRGPVTLALSGPKQVLDNTRVTSSADTLYISQEHASRVWNWHEWFNFKLKDHRDKITLEITAPKGTALEAHDFVGVLNVGDLEAPVKIGAAAASGSIGNVTSADIELAGSGKLEIGRVAQQLKIEIAGSGTVDAGASAGAMVEIGGSGDANLGPVLGKLKIEIAGSGDVDIASVNGPTSVETAGSGSVKIGTGEANPLKVEIVGAGDFTFGGEAVDPTFSTMGSGDISIKSYRGKLNTEGSAHIKIGNND